MKIDETIKNCPKVSILLPNYNGAKYLREAINSVINQSYENYEFIIIDDDSADNSRDIISSYSDDRIRLICLEKGRHISYALNEGLKQARGEYIARIDADDIWNPDKLAKQITYMEDNTDIAACFTKADIIDSNSDIANDKYSDIYQLMNGYANKSQKEWIHFFLEKGNCLIHPSVVVRRSILNVVGEYGIPYVPGEDFDMWSRIVVKKPIFVIEEKLIKYRWTEDEVKVSGTNESGINAFENVHMLVRKRILESLSDDEFIKYFGEDFINPESKTSLELKCEKAFILLNVAANKEGNNNFLGLQYFEEILNTDGGLELLESKYNFDLRSHYKLYRKRNFCDGVMHSHLDSYDDMRLYINNLEEKVSWQNSQVEFIETARVELEKYKDALEEKVSWQNSHIEFIEAARVELEKYKDALEEKNRVLEEASNEYYNKLMQCENQLMQCENQLMQCENQLERIKNSYSWRITAPIRKVLSLFNK